MSSVNRKKVSQPVDIVTVAMAIRAMADDSRERQMAAMSWAGVTLVWTMSSKASSGMRAESSARASRASFRLDDEARPKKAL